MLYKTLTLSLLALTVSSSLFRSHKNKSNKLKGVDDYPRVNIPSEFAADISVFLLDQSSKTLTDTKQIANLKVSTQFNHICLELSHILDDGHSAIDGVFVDNLNSSRKIYYNKALSQPCGSEFIDDPVPVKDMISRVFDPAFQTLSYQGLSKTLWKSEDKNTYNQLDVLDTDGSAKATYLYSETTGFPRYVITYGPMPTVYDIKNFRAQTFTIKDFLVQQCLQSQNPASVSE
jgi:hypothetical protein